MVRKAGRPKTSTLTRALIITTAMRVVDEGGVEALSMRRLAGELKVDPMALYHYLPNKKSVIGALIEQVYDTFRLSLVSSASWQDQLRGFAAAYREMARVHPHLMMTLVADSEATAEGVLKINELLYGILQLAELTPARILNAGDLVIDFLNGFALGDRSKTLEQPGEHADVLHQLDTYPQEQFPVLRWLYMQIDSDDMRTRFDASFEIIIAGVEGMAKDK